LGIFHVLGESMRKPTFRGCAFLNARGESLGRQLAMLYDGPTVAARMDHNPKAAAIARKAAEVVLDAATAAPAIAPRAS
jgi:hypothetical protein